MVQARSKAPPILAEKHYDAPSAFTPDSLLPEARRQKALTASVVPALCILDPDGDLVSRLIAIAELAGVGTGFRHHVGRHVDAVDLAFIIHKPPGHESINAGAGAKFEHRVAGPDAGMLGLMRDLDRKHGPY